MLSSNAKVWYARSRYTSGRARAAASAAGRARLATAEVPRKMPPFGETAAAPGDRVRARVLARDVSVARHAPVETSVINVLPVVLEDLRVERHTAVLRLRLPGDDGARLLARITRRSAEALGLTPGDALHAQVKGVALM